MRYLKVTWLAASIILCLLFVSNAQAITVGEPVSETRTNSPIIMTGYAIDGGQVLYAQLFNSSDAVVDVTNWTFQAAYSNGTSTTLANLHGLVKPGGYLVVADTNVISAPDVGYSQVAPDENLTVASLQLMAPTLYLTQQLAVKADATHPYWRRNISSSTGAYLSTFSSFVPDSQFILFGNGLYEYPENAPLQITEIMTNPRNCSPVETTGDCMDYVKFYNPTTQDINLSRLRLRVGYLGQTSSLSNTFQLQGTVSPGHYTVITTSMDGRPINLTSSGGFIWLEDAYGIKRYDTTVFEYPDASANTKKGQAWAYDSSDGMWKWTTQPTPLDTRSVFPPSTPQPQKKSVQTGTLTQCKEGQYRSEETNRCRSTGNVTALASCDNDEERNPATNRCRKRATAASQELAPCKEGQERNPVTNRCRNLTNSVPGDAAFAVETAQDAGKAFIGWWALGGVGAVALGYGAWEWREEARMAIRKVSSFFTSLK